MFRFQRRASNRITYDLADYTDEGVLKVSVTLWLVILYLCRQPVIVLLVGVTSLVGRRRGMDLSGLDALPADPLLMLGSAPALLVLLAAARRVAGAGPLVRTMWKQGRGLLMLAALSDILLHYLQAPARISELALAGLAPPLVDLYLLIYLAGSRRIADIFAQFPPKPTD